MISPLNLSLQSVSSPVINFINILKQFVEIVNVWCRKPVLKIKLLSENAYVPTKATNHAAGHDLFATRNIIIAPNSQELINTDIAIQPPPGTYGRIVGRSGMNKLRINVISGTVDIDYTGEISILIRNNSDKNYLISRGDRIAQLICEKIEYATIVCVSELPRTTRAANGFGSSGK